MIEATQPNKPLHLGCGVNLVYSALLVPLSAAFTCSLPFSATQDVFFLSPTTLSIG